MATRVEGSSTDSRDSQPLKTPVRKELHSLGQPHEPERAAAHENALPELAHPRRYVDVKQRVAVVEGHAPYPPQGLRECDSPQVAAVVEGSLVVTIVVQPGRQVRNAGGHNVLDLPTHSCTYSVLLGITEQKFVSMWACLHGPSVALAKRCHTT